MLLISLCHILHLHTLLPLLLLLYYPNALYDVMSRDVSYFNGCLNCGDGGVDYGTGRANSVKGLLYCVGSWLIKVVFKNSSTVVRTPKILLSVQW